jgi:hypothetical protein
MERNGDALDADCASAVDTEMGATVRWGFRLNVYRCVHTRLGGRIR